MKNKSSTPVTITDPTIIESLRKDVRTFLKNYYHLLTLFRLPYCKIVIEAPVADKAWMIRFSVPGENDIQKISFSRSAVPDSGDVICHVIYNNSISDPILMKEKGAVALHEKYFKLSQFTTDIINGMYPETFSLQF